MGCARAATPSRAPPFTASPAAQLVYNDSWCGDENLIPGTSTTNTEPTISWGTCSSRCAAKGFDCAYFVWGVCHVGQSPQRKPLRAIHGLQTHGKLCRRRSSSIPPVDHYGDADALTDSVPDARWCGPSIGPCGVGIVGIAVCLAAD